MRDPRYEGKPLLRLIELWVLWVIGELDGVNEERLKKMEPNFHKTWGHDGAWHDMIEATLHLPASLAVEIRRMWQNNLHTAERQGVAPPTEMFARAIADQIAGDAG
jgi:hypothetical protein